MLHVGKAARGPALITVQVGHRSLRKGCVHISLFRPLQRPVHRRKLLEGVRNRDEITRAPELLYRGAEAVHCRGKILVVVSGKDADPQPGQSARRRIP
jgi:hypothetical protein